MSNEFDPGGWRKTQWAKNAEKTEKAREAAKRKSDWIELGLIVATFSIICFVLYVIVGT